MVFFLMDSHGFSADCIAGAVQRGVFNVGIGMGLQSQGQIAGFGAGGTRARRVRWNCSITPRNFCRPCKWGLLPSGCPTEFGQGCFQRRAGSLAGIAGNIGKGFRHFGNVYRRNCYYIYNDYLRRTACRAYRAAPSQAGFGIGDATYGLGCLCGKALCAFVGIFYACHFDFAQYW